MKKIRAVNTSSKTQGVRPIGVIQASIRSKDDTEVEVQLGKKVEDIPEFLDL